MEEELNSPIRRVDDDYKRKIKFIEYIGYTFIITGTIVVLFGMFVFQRIADLQSVKNHLFNFIVGGLSLFIFGFLLYDFHLWFPPLRLQ
ncbi:MAG: hypothetical protein ACXAB0_15735 [Candidatus Thorarchaeota archaeon]